MKTILFLILLIMFQINLAGQEGYKVPVRSGNEPVAEGRFEPTWESLSQYQVPEWFRNAKFGIWAHWGPQCQPGQGDWYARNMYDEGGSQYKSHVEKYGHPSEVGFKDVINSWKAEKWDPEKLVALYKRAGAQYFFAMANHHDNLDMWDSKYQEWNTTRVGPEKDILAGWAAAAKKYDLPLGLSVHASHAWSWLETSQRSDKTGEYAGVPYDGKLTTEDGKGTWWEGLDPQELYAQNHPLSEGSEDINSIHRQWTWVNGVAVPSPDYVDKFYNRTIDMINRFNPDLVYFDDTALPLYPISDAGLKIAAHFYNTNTALHNGKLEAVLFGKVLTDEQKKCMVWDVERGAPDRIQTLPWQTCTCIGEWHYSTSAYENNRYKSANDVIHMLVDVVSKNGNLLLNIPVRGDGSVDEKEIVVIEGITAWMDINKESIFDTRPWKVFGEGPSAEASNPINAQGFNEGRVKYSAKDLRFNQKGNTIYVTVMGIPGENITVTNLGSTTTKEKISKIELLGSSGTVKWKQNAERLEIEKPDSAPNGIAIVYKVQLWGQPFPYQNPALSSEERARDLISRLTVTEKAALMCDISDAIPRLGIKKFNWWSEALHGLANNDNVTVFPQPVGMAASFDDELVYNIFNAVSDETRARYNEEKQKGGENKRFLSLSVWTPNINIFRDPRWGRGQETYGEDPYLTSRMGISVVKGLQGPADAKYRKLLACAKHFAVHSGPEWSRHSLNVTNVDPLDMYETYLPAFKTLVQEADVRQVMCAYQRLEDEPCCGNSRLLQRILRDEWGYKYIVVSDCDAIADFYNGHKVSSDNTHAAAMSLPAGTDVECAWNNHNYKKLPDAVSLDLIKEEDMDKSLLRVLVGRFDLGEMDDDEIVPWAKIPASVINNEEHRKLALDMARETMTLLQNKNNILPLNKSGKKIAVIGPNADDERVLWGNYNGTPIRTITVLDGIKSKIPGNKIFYDRACDLVEQKVLESFASKSSINGKQGFKVTYWNNSDMSGDAVADQQLTGSLKLATEGKNELAPGVNLEGFSARFETEFTPSKTEEIVFKWGAAGSFEFLVNDVSLAKSGGWRILPSKTPYKVEEGKTYKIEIRYAQLHNWQAAIEFDFGRETDQDFSGLIAKLKGIDVVVFVGGLSNLLEGEEMPVSYPGFKGGDRTDIELPAAQRNCIRTLKEAGKKVILVNCSGSAMGFVPETETCDAILQAWYGGESGGQAVADVLFGDYNPSGKLPVTFYRSIEQLPDFEDYTMKGRTYRYMSDPLFPFGFGLSYTTFTIGTAQICKNEIDTGGGCEITVPVSNTGKRNGTEIVQTYIRMVNNSDGQLKSLRAYQRVNLAAGKSSEITIDLPRSSFEFFDRASGKMAVVPGDYEVWYGTSSDTKDLKMVNITIQ